MPGMTPMKGEGGRFGGSRFYAPAVSPEFTPEAGGSIPAAFTKEMAGFSDKRAAL